MGNHRSLRKAVCRSLGSARPLSELTLPASATRRIQQGWLSLVGGHEGIGEIVSLGEGAENWNFGVGDVVGIAWRGAVCKECTPCLLGAENYCDQLGMHRDGAFQRSY